MLSPKAYHPDISILIENKMSSNVFGKIVKKNGQVVAEVAIVQGEFKAVPLGMKSEDRIFFIPYAPAQQSVELIIGKDSYEIPPKK